MSSKFIKNFTHYRLNFVWTLSSGMVKNSHWTFFTSYPDYFSFNKVIFSPEIHAKRSKVWRIPPTKRLWRAICEKWRVICILWYLVFFSIYLNAFNVPIVFNQNAKNFCTYNKYVWGDSVSLPTSSSRLEVLRYYRILYNTWINVFIKDFYPLLSWFTKV